MLFAVYLYEDLIDVEGVTVATMFTLQSSGVKRSELDAPQADRFSGERDTSFSQDIFDVPVAEVEAIVEQDSIGNNIWREAVTFIGIY